MTLEELQELAEKDLKINDIELDIASLQTPQIHNKYLKFLTKLAKLNLGNLVIDDLCIIVVAKIITSPTSRFVLIVLKFLGKFNGFLF